MNVNTLEYVCRIILPRCVQAIVSRSVEYYAMEMGSDTIGLIACAYCSIVQRSWVVTYGWRGGKMGSGTQLLIMMHGSKGADDHK